MTKESYNPSRQVYGVPGLDQFMDRLRPGLELDGRIVDVLDKNIYVLRIWGNNILAESSHNFDRFDEVILHVRAVRPKLIFTLKPAGASSGGALYA